MGAKRRMLRWLAFWAASLIVSSCGVQHACTLVGAVSGVQVTGGEEGAAVQVCAGSSCGTTKLIGGAGFVTLPTLIAGRGVDLKVTFTSATDRVESQTKVVPVKLEPNGPGCAPAAAMAELRLDPAGHAG